MPSVAKSRQWFIRITAPWEFIEGKLNDIEAKIWYDGMMIGYHIGDKGGAPHAHIALKIKSELQKQSIDKCLKEVFNIVNRTTYSSKVWDGDNKALSYLYHDPKGRVDNRMRLSDIEIDDLRRNCALVQAAVKVAKEKASNKLIDYVIERYDRLWTRWDIASCILRAVAEGKFHDPGDYNLERYVNEIELRCAHKEELEDVISRRLAKLKSFQ